MANYYISIIALIVVISLAAVVYVDSATGAYSASYGRGAKVYGGGMKQVYSTETPALGQAATQQLFLERAQAYMYANKDKWNCTFGAEAETSPDPCFFDEELQKYCCADW